MWLCFAAGQKYLKHSSHHLDLVLLVLPCCPWILTRRSEVENFHQEMKKLQKVVAKCLIASGKSEGN